MVRKEARLTLRLEPEMREKLESYAESIGLSTSTIVRMALQMFMEEVAANPEKTLIRAIFGNTGETGR